MRLRENADTPDWLAAAVTHQFRNSVSLADRYISVTTLLKPPHMVRLQDAHSRDIEVDPDDSIPGLIGTAWHVWIQQYMPEGGQTEQRLTADIGDWRLTGQPDFFNSTRLDDHKTTRVWSRLFGQPSWEQQVNCYAYLVKRTYGYDIQDLRINAIYLDWSETSSLRNPDLPQKRWEVIPVERWDFATTEEFIKARLTALEGELNGVCSAEDRWERNEAWAVKKPGRKSAIKVFASEEEAEEMAATSALYYVEHRDGDPVRCRRYCDVVPFCEHGREVSRARNDGDV